MKLIDLVFFGFYRFVLIPLALVLLRLLRPMLPEDHKLRKMIESRQGPQRPALVARPIWIHAASGEIEYAKPLIRELKKNYPQIPILLTYFSPSAERLFRSTPDIDVALPIPWDERHSIARFIEYAKPLAVLFARTDVWPELAYQLKQKKIPSVLFSATLARNSSRARGLGQFLSRFALNHLEQILCVNEADVREFQRLGVTTTLAVTGDSRYDQVRHRLAEAKPIKALVHQTSAKTPMPPSVLVFGSTWPQDEEVLLAALTLPHSQPWPDNVRVIWAPHEVTEGHLQALEKQILAKGWSSQRYSTSETWPESVPILIVDQVGILPELYACGDLAFVGGSFKDRVHSVMEPLAAGLPVLVGPYFENNREALHFSLKSLAAILPALPQAYSIVHSCTDSDQLRLSWTQFLKASQASDRSLTKSGIQALIELESGATERILARLQWDVGEVSS